MKKQPTFEQAMERLETIVRELEQGDAPLEKSLSLFEEGTALIRDCSRRLDDTEQRIMLLKKGTEGEATEEPFPPME